MAVDLRTTQEYLNAKAGTVGRTKQECLAILSSMAPGTNQKDHGTLANNYAGVTGRTAQDALSIKAGVSPIVGLSKQEAARRI